MLCPHCKNEKWTEDVCPRCGLDQKAALLTQGDLYQKDGRNPEAARCYEQYLKLDPDCWDVERKKAICLYADALAQKGGSFAQADQALGQALDKQWDWEQGHQFRVNLAFAYGRLGEVQDQYEKIAAENPDRKEQAEKTMKIILLTERFAEPDPDPASPPEKSWRPSNLLTLTLLLALPLWLWILLRTLQPTTPGGETGNGATLWLLGSLMAGTAVLFFVFQFFRREVRGPGGRKARKTSGLNFPPE
ncbi:MAG TPA: tetratricopeptide repeat protein [bacterium]|nr:tetratricopeptide repeat protein [bacterium]